MSELIGIIILVAGLIALYLLRPRKDYTQSILVLLSERHRPMTAQNISRELNIGSASLYPALRKLEMEKHIIRYSRKCWDGKTRFFYRRGTWTD